MVKKNIWNLEGYVKKYNKFYGNSLKEFLEAADILRLNKKDILVDFGCGNGDFLKYVCKKIKYGVGVDTSVFQIKNAKRKFKNIKNTDFVKSDFLSFETDLIFTKGFARKSLHHLNHFEKKKFFKKISKFFKKGSLFLLFDGIFFDFTRREITKNWKKLIDECKSYYADEWESKKKDVIYCFKKEYPEGITEWESAAKEGGFKIVKTGRKSSFYGYILFKKVL